jgi:hypothetical protein
MEKGSGLNWVRFPVLLQAGESKSGIWAVECCRVLFVKAVVCCTMFVCVLRT